LESVLVFRRQDIPLPDGGPARGPVMHLMNIASAILRRRILRNLVIVTVMSIALGVGPTTLADHYIKNYSCTGPCLVTAWDAVHLPRAPLIALSPMNGDRSGRKQSSTNLRGCFISARGMDKHITKQK